MSVFRHVEFMRDLLSAIVSEVQFRYYRLAYRTVGERHPDSALIQRRMCFAQLRVTDFIRKWTA